MSRGKLGELFMIVQKFGGIATKDKNMRRKSIEHIKRGIAEHGKVIVIVSAMGRRGDPYATDSLLGLTNAFSSSKEAADLVAACGELISSAVLSAELTSAGIDNELLYGSRSGILTNNYFTDADLLHVDTSTIETILTQTNCIIIPGFQGMTIDQKFTTLGRGGSDLTAVVIASALNVKFVEFYKDVPGVMTDDPKRGYDVQKFDNLHYRDFCKILEDGSNIIQKKAAELAELHKIPLHIRSVYSNDIGTWIPQQVEA